MRTMYIEFFTLFPSKKLIERTVVPRARKPWPLIRRSTLIDILCLFCAQRTSRDMQFFRYHFRMLTVEHHGKVQRRLGICGPGNDDFAPTKEVSIQRESTRPQQNNRDSNHDKIESRQVYGEKICSRH